MKRLESLLTERLATLPPAPLWLGFSGGLDSSVLLHALAHLPQARGRGLTALHVCHGLHPDADIWAQRARTFAERLELPFRRADVAVGTIAQEGVEAAARRARYAAFARQLPNPGILALAQHRDDQVETVLLRLLHGAGQEGLAGMRALRPLRGDEARLVWRPLLDCPRAMLVDYAGAHGLDWIEDPANANPGFIRNRLRHAVIPALRAQFPDADARIAASAARLREEADALDHVARRELATQLAHDRSSLACEALRAMPIALRRRLLGFWLDRLDLPRPPPGIWQRIGPELLDARPDANPELVWRGARLRRHRARLFADADTSEPKPDWQLAWDGASTLQLPGTLGTLAFEPAPDTRQDFIVRPRRGGEHLSLRGHRRSLKKLLQEAGIPPWQRRDLPLLFDRDQTLLSVVGHWHSDRFAQWLARHAIRLEHRTDGSGEDIG